MMEATAAAASDSSVLGIYGKLNNLRRVRLLFGRCSTDCDRAAPYGGLDTRTALNTFGYSKARIPRQAPSAVALTFWWAERHMPTALIVVPSSLHELFGCKI